MQAATVRVSWGRLPRTIPVKNAPATLPSVVEAVRRILSDPGADDLSAKLALDRIVDPAIDARLVRVAVERLAEAASAMAGPAAGPDVRLAALRRVLNEAGPWNGHRPFAYDHDDPLGQSIRAKLLGTYLATRRGNCVSMPILLLVLGRCLGLDMALATAPLHILVQYRDERGRMLNLEAMSGAHQARLDWYRANMSMSDRSLESGLYMRALSPVEGRALMATTVLEYLMECGRFGEAIGVADAILHVAPRDGYTLAKQGSACAELIQREFHANYATPEAIPAAMRTRYMMLAQRNQAAFAAAEALGWRADD